jgi:hypothetical protein
MLLELLQIIKQAEQRQLLLLQKEVKQHATEPLLKKL